MVKSGEIFTPDFKPIPWWWEASPRRDDDGAILPQNTQVLIIGAGYTGLHAAIQAARAGLSTTIIDAEDAGWGCSTRNGGQISTSIKPNFETLKKHHGEELAISLLKEGQASLEHVEAFVRDESIECDFKVVGRFHGAHTPKQYEQLARECDTHHPGFETGAWMVTRERQHSELGTDAYYGGMVFPHHASIDPGKYHAGLLKVARAEGVKIINRCAATAVAKTAHGFSINTVKGPISAEKVIIATNGYTGALTPRLQRRVIPIGSYVIATEEIQAETMDRLFPKNRILSDTRKLVYYYRPSPDRKRVIFGGRVSLWETDPRKSGPKLHAELINLFPELRHVRISHSWAGSVAFTFDTMAHCGEDNGLYYAMGYCGSGVGMAGYLGSRMGMAAAGLEQEPSCFTHLKFQTLPLYSGRPWFLAPSVAWYRLRDKLSF